YERIARGRARPGERRDGRDQDRQVRASPEDPVEERPDRRARHERQREQHSEAELEKGLRSERAPAHPTLLLWSTSSGKPTDDGERARAGNGRKPRNRPRGRAALRARGRAGRGGGAELRPAGPGGQGDRGRRRQGSRAADERRGSRLGGGG